MGLSIRSRCPKMPQAAQISACTTWLQSFWQPKKGVFVRRFHWISPSLDLWGLYLCPWFWPEPPQFFTMADQPRCFKTFRHGFTVGSWGNSPRHLRTTSPKRTHFFLSSAIHPFWGATSTADRSISQPLVEAPRDTWPCPCSLPPLPHRRALRCRGRWNAGRRDRCNQEPSWWSLGAMANEDTINYYRNNIT